MSLSSPRWFDGRVRRVIEVKFIRAGTHVRARIETLECGHKYVPTRLVNGGNEQHRVCFECEAVAA